MGRRGLVVSSSLDRMVASIRSSATWELSFAGSMVKGANTLSHREEGRILGKCHDV